MTIGIAGPFNPYCVRDFFNEKADIPNINITASSVNIYVRSLLNCGYNVIVFTSIPFDIEPRVLRGDRIVVYCISAKYFIRGFGRYRMHKRIRESIKKEIAQIDVLHAEWTYEYALAVLPFVNTIPVFCSVRDWCPYLLANSQTLYSKYYWHMSYFMFNRVMNENRVTFIANSQYIFDKISTSYPDNKVVIIPNPIEIDSILISRDEYPVSPVFVSISASLSNPRKNIKTLLVAFKKYTSNRPEAKLILIGSYTDKWLNYIKAEKLLDNVELKGQLNRSDVFSVLDHSTCLIHPSLEESFGNILLEAMCRRIPCIGGISSGAVTQVLGEGKYGLLCDVSDPESILESMKKIEDRELFTKIVNESTANLLSSYSDEKIAMLHTMLFEDAIKKNEK